MPSMKEDTKLHFGWWMLWEMKRHGFGRMKDLAIASGLSERQLWRLVEQAEPVGILSKTLVGLSRSFRIDPDQFDSRWRQPVPMPPEIKQRHRKHSREPTTAEVLADIDRLTSNLEALSVRGETFPPEMIAQIEQLAIGLEKLSSARKRRK